MKLILRFGLVVAVGIVVLFFLNKDKANTEYSISASKLAGQYLEDESAADSIYLGKKLQISGTLLHVEPGTSQQTWTVEGSGSANIRIEFPVEQLPAPLPSGSQVSVKGVCAGFLLDVIITEAELINDDEN